MFIQSKYEVKESDEEERATLVKYFIKISSYSPALTVGEKLISRKLAITYIKKMLGKSFEPMTYYFKEKAEDGTSVSHSFVDIFYRLNTYKLTRENQELNKNEYFEKQLGDFLVNFMPKRLMAVGL